MTLADLIDRHRTLEAEYNEVRARYEASLARLRRAFETLTPGTVSHAGEHWCFYREDSGLCNFPPCKQPYEVPDAASVVVPEAILGDRDAGDGGGGA